MWCPNMTTNVPSDVTTNVGLHMITIVGLNMITNVGFRHYPVRCELTTNLNSNSGLTLTHQLITKSTNHVDAMYLVIA